MTYDKLISLWPEGCPHNNQPDDAMALGCPAVRHFIAPERRPAPRPRAAIIICPGGGYGHRARHEGDPFAAMFNLHGIDAFVLDYRIAPHRFPAPYADAARAVRLVRSLAGELRLDPQRIGLMGFSAGGHLASTVAAQPDLHHDEHDDLAGRIFARPDRVILGYPVISADWAITHKGSFLNLLGPRQEDDPAQVARLDALRKQLSNDLHVTADAPPAFLFHTADDGGVTVQHSLAYAAACAQAGVSCELHVYQHGPHGVGMALTDPKLASWTALLMHWLADWAQPLH